MEYTDFYIAQEKAHISPITTDAIYYVTADAGYHIVHPRPADHMIFVATMRGHGRILLYCRPPGFTVMPLGRYMAGGLQSGCTANLTGVQYKWQKP